MQAFYYMFFFLQFSMTLIVDILLTLHICEWVINQFSVLNIEPPNLNQVSVICAIISQELCHHCDLLVGVNLKYSDFNSDILTKTFYNNYRW